MGQDLLSVKKWQSIISCWQSSNKTMKKWCQENNIVYSQFFYWKQRLYDLKDSSGTKGAFSEIVDDASMDSGVSLEIDGITILLSKDFDPSTLFRCIQLLKVRKTC